MTTIFSFQPKQNDPLLTNRQKFFLPTQITTKKIKWTTVHENVSCGRTQTAQTQTPKTQTSNLYGQHTKFLPTLPIQNTFKQNGQLSTKPF